MGTFRVLCDLKLIMRYVAAYLLAVLGGNASPSAADVKAIISSVGIDAEDDKLAKVIEELKGKNVEELMAEGSKKLASVPSGGGGGAAPAAGGAAAVGAAPAAEEKKEEKKEESEEEMTTWDSDFSTKPLGSSQPCICISF